MKIISEWKTREIIRGHHFNLTIKFEDFSMKFENLKYNFNRSSKNHKTTQSYMHLHNYALCTWSNFNYAFRNDCNVWSTYGMKDRFKHFQGPSRFQPLTNLEKPGQMAVVLWGWEGNRGPGGQ